MHFEGNGVELAVLLEQHDMLHARISEHEADEHTEISDEIRANVAAIYALVGLPGIRGLIHVAHEALDTAAHLGLPLDARGEFERAEDSEAYLSMMADANEIAELIRLLAMYEGKLPADAH
jgi:hypothetical protein